MPKSRIRRKVKEAAVSTEKFSHAAPAPTESPKWLPMTMVGLFIAGLIWIVIFYISSTKYPIPGFGAWNMVFGFSFIAAGFALATRWR